MMNDNVMTLSRVLERTLMRNQCSKRCAFAEHFFNYTM